MKSTITKLYDYKQSVIPEELRRWRVKDEEVRSQLETLSRNHAFEADAEEVRTGDSVACRGESPAARWDRETLLIYPGHGLMPVMEDALVGAKVGESRTAETAEGPVKLTVRRIVRRSNMPIGDELVRLEGIEGVETVADYDRWYREDKGAFYRQQALYRSANFLLEEIQMKSGLSIDPEEKDAWLRDRVNVLYDAMVAAGMDPKIPSEGFDFLTEEQAKEKMYRESESFFTEFVVQAYMAEQLSGKSLEDICREGVERTAAENGVSVEQVQASSGKALISGKFAMEKALEELGKYAEQFLEA